MNSTKAVRLQGVGRVIAAEAQDLSVGDQIMWNYGSISRVEAVEDVSAAYLLVTLLSEHGQRSARRLKKTRLVALAAPLVGGEPR